MSKVPVTSYIQLAGLAEVLEFNQNNQYPPPPPPPPPSSSFLPSSSSFLPSSSSSTSQKPSLAAGSNKRKTLHTEELQEYKTSSGDQPNEDEDAKITVLAAPGSKSRTKRSGRIVAKSSADKHTVPAASRTESHQEHQQPGPSTRPATTEESSTPARSNKNLKATIGVKTFHCTVQNCGKSYTSAKALSAHKKNSHPIENAPPTHECTRCNDMFPTKTALNKHVKAIHRSDFKCSLCSKCTGRGNLLRKHIQENHPDVDIAETLVDIYMTSKGHESGSVSIFLCSKCEYYTVDKFQFKEHIPKRHGGNGTATIVAKCLEETAARDDARFKSYKCILCRWKTTQANAITDHVAQVHSTQNTNDVSEAILRTLNQEELPRSDMETVFKCYLCKYTGESNHALLLHTKKRHEEYNVAEVYAFSIGKGSEPAAPPKNVPWFQCNFCPKSRRRLANIKRHASRMHRDRMNGQAPFWEELGGDAAAEKEKEYVGKNDGSGYESDEVEAEVEDEVEEDEEPARKIRKVESIGQSMGASKRK